MVVGIGVQLIVERKTRDLRIDANVLVVGRDPVEVVAEVTLAVLIGVVGVVQSPLRHLIGGGAHGRILLQLVEIRDQRDVGGIADRR